MRGIESAELTARHSPQRRTCADGACASEGYAPGALNWHHAAQVLRMSFSSFNFLAHVPQLVSGYVVFSALGVDQQKPDFPALSRDAKHTKLRGSPIRLFTSSPRTNIVPGKWAG